MSSRPSGLTWRTSFRASAKICRDHPNCRLTFECSKPITINDVLQRPMSKLKEGLRFIFFGKGLLSICSATAHTVMRSGPGRTSPISSCSCSLSRARIDMHDVRRMDWIPIPVLPSASWRFVLTRAATFISIQPIRPFSRASTRIILRTSAMRRPSGGHSGGSPAGANACAERSGGAGNASRPEAHRTADYRLYSPDHPNDLARRRQLQDGQRRISCVDSDLRVRGIDGLRVINSSVFPTVPSSNTNAPTIALRRKRGRYRLESWPTMPV